MTDVKTTSGKTRRDRARETRLRILQAAGRMFAQDGYAGTTMEAIAGEAGVAVQTVYYTFKTKSSLVREALELAGAGELDAQPVERRDWMREALIEEDGDRVLAIAVEHGVDIYVGAAPLWPAVRAAALVDPEVDSYFRQLAERRRAGMRRLVGHLDELRYLRDGLDVEHGGDAVFALFSHDTFLALTSDAGWSVPMYKAWLWQALRGQLAGVEPAAAPSGFSFGPS